MFPSRYNAAGDLWDAAAFAAVAGALTVEGEGTAGVPTRERLLERWRALEPR